MDAKQLVQQLCDQMAMRDAEALRPFLADDIIYQNAGMEAAVGIDDVIANLEFQMSMFPDTYEYETLNVVAEGNLVMNERLDFMSAPDGSKHGLPVMGMFVVADGKVTRWTDYWDSALLGKMMSGDDYSSLVPRR